MEQDFRSAGEELSSASLNKATKQANTFKSCIHRGILTGKQSNCSLNGSGETTLGKRSSSPGHCREMETAHQGKRKCGSGNWLIWGGKKHLRILLW